MAEIKIFSEDIPEYSMMEIKSRWAKFEISAGSDGYVEICCEHNDGSDSAFLNQEQLVQLIDFLKTKIK